MSNYNLTTVTQVFKHPSGAHIPVTLTYSIYNTGATHQILWHGHVCGHKLNHATIMGFVGLRFMHHLGRLAQQQFENLTP